MLPTNIINGSSCGAFPAPIAYYNNTNANMSLNDLITSSSFNMMMSMPPPSHMSYSSQY